MDAELAGQPYVLVVATQIPEWRITLSSVASFNFELSDAQSLWAMGLVLI